MQSRLMSAVEATANVAVGYGVAVITQVMVFPLFGLNASLIENLLLGSIFTIVSLIMFANIFVQGRSDSLSIYTASGFLIFGVLMMIKN